MRHAAAMLTLAVAVVLSGLTGPVGAATTYNPNQGSDADGFSVSVTDAALKTTWSLVTADTAQIANLASASVIRVGYAARQGLDSLMIGRSSFSPIAIYALGDSSDSTSNSLDLRQGLGALGTWSVTDTISPHQQILTMLALPDTNIVLAGTGNDSGCVFRSVDGGVTFAKVTRLGARKAVGAFVSFSTGQTVYAGAGAGYGGADTAVVYVSTDYGATWAVSDTLNGAEDVPALTSWSTGLTVLAAASDPKLVIWRKKRYSSSWDSIGQVGNVRYAGSIAAVADTKRVAVVTSNADSCVIYRTLNYGTTWTKIVTCASAYSPGAASFGSGIVLVGNGDGTGASGSMYRSANYGAGFTQITLGTTPLGYQVAAVNDTVVVCGGGGDTTEVFRSTDSGETWITVLRVVDMNRAKGLAVVGDSAIVVGAVDADSTRQKVWRSRIDPTDVAYVDAAFGSGMSPRYDRGLERNMDSGFALGAAWTLAAIVKPSHKVSDDSLVADLPLNYASLSGSRTFLDGVAGDTCGFYPSTSTPTFTYGPDGDYRGAVNVVVSSSNYINASEAFPAIASSNKGTWNIWVRFTDGNTSSTQRVVSVCSASINENISLYVQPTGEVGANSRIATEVQWSLLTSAARFANGACAWAMLTLTHDGSKPTIYVNGDSVSQSFTASTNTTAWVDKATTATKLLIGALQVTSTVQNYTGGGLSNFRAYTRCLSRDEVKQLYETERIAMLHGDDHQAYIEYTKPSNYIRAVVSDSAGLAADTLLHEVDVYDTSRYVPVVFSCLSSTIKLNVDGTTLDSMSLVHAKSTLASVNGISVGGGKSNTNPFRGIIDEVYVVGSKLSTDLIRHLASRVNYLGSDDPDSASVWVAGLAADTTLKTYRLYVNPLSDAQTPSMLAFEGAWSDTAQSQSLIAYSSAYSPRGSIVDSIPTGVLHRPQALRYFGRIPKRPLLERFTVTKLGPADTVHVQVRVYPNWVDGRGDMADNYYVLWEDRVLDGESAHTIDLDQILPHSSLIAVFAKANTTTGSSISVRMDGRYNR